MFALHYVYTSDHGSADELLAVSHDIVKLMATVLDVKWENIGTERDIHYRALIQDNPEWPDITQHYSITPVEYLT